MVDRDFCISSYLTFRYVVKEGITWKEGFMPRFPDAGEQGQFRVSDASSVLERLRKIIAEKCQRKPIGMLMSGGMDSAIIAALMPRNTCVYTINFKAPRAIDEGSRAKIYTEKLGLEHRIVEVTWDNYLEDMDKLMLHKKSALHPVEVGLFKAATMAKADGIDTLVVGNGADSTFGGMDKLLSKDWTFDEFVKRYTFVEPSLVLKRPISMRNIYEEYRIDGGVNVQRFLKVVHGLGIIQMFDNAIELAGCSTIAPYEFLILDKPLDLQRIRKGQTKYILREVFRELYPGLDIPEKIAFVRPMDDWMSQWKGPERPEFLDGLDVSQFSGEQRWLLFCLDRFLGLIQDK